MSRSERAQWEALAATAAMRWGLVNHPNGKDTRLADVVAEWQRQAWQAAEAEHLLRQWTGEALDDGEDCTLQDWPTMSWMLGEALALRAKAAERLRRIFAVVKVRTPARTMLPGEIKVHASLNLTAPRLDVVVDTMEALRWEGVGPLFCRYRVDRGEGTVSLHPVFPSLNINDFSLEAAHAFHAAALRQVDDLQNALRIFDGPPKAGEPVSNEDSALVALGDLLECLQFDPRYENGGLHVSGYAVTVEKVKRWCGIAGVPYPESLTAEPAGDSEVPAC